eukprot:900564-Pleurochrysis_carterae.AAC.4
MLQVRVESAYGHMFSGWVEDEALQTRRCFHSTERKLATTLSHSSTAPPPRPTPPAPPSPPSPPSPPRPPRPPPPSPSPPPPPAPAQPPPWPPPPPHLLVCEKWPGQHTEHLPPARPQRLHHPLHEPDRKRCIARVGVRKLRRVLAHLHLKSRDSRTWTHSRARCWHRLVSHAENRGNARGATRSERSRGNGRLCAGWKGLRADRVQIAAHASQALLDRARREASVPDASVLDAGVRDPASRRPGP